MDSDISVPVSVLQLHSNLAAVFLRSDGVREREGLMAQSGPWSTSLCLGGVL